MTNEVVQEVPVAPKHPLLSGPTKMISSFAELRELWETVPVVEFRLGLLHVGFDVPHGQDEKAGDRIKFYLDVADGYSGLSNGPLRDTPMRGMPAKRDFSIVLYDSAVFKRARSTEEVLRQIAFKAFHTVVQRFFKTAPREKAWSNKWENSHWLTYPGVIEKIIWFFRVSGGSFGIENLSYSEDEDTKRIVNLAKNFMAELCRAACAHSSVGRAAPF
jgi:hypothetical protein